MIAPGLTNEKGIENLEFFIKKMEADKLKLDLQIGKMKARISELEKLPKKEPMTGKFLFPLTLA